MASFVLAMYVAMANGVTVPVAVQVVAWVLAGINAFVLIARIFSK